MHASVRPFATASLALVASGLVAVTPIAQAPELQRVTAAVRLVDFSDLLSGFDLGGLENIPYNLFADFVNIPANEINAMGIWADALGAPNQVAYFMDPATGVLTQLPVPADGITPPTPVGDIPLGISGTGSWWGETLGNTWGWDDGNFGQLDGLMNMFLPFPQFTTPLAEEIQIFQEAGIVAGANVPYGCEFECANVLGYLGGWYQEPLTQLLSGFNFGTVLQGGVGGDPIQTIWSNTSAILNPLLPLESLWSNLTASPSADPITLPDPGTFLTNYLSLVTDFNTDFNPFATGSFLYWGLPTDYSLPSMLGGILQSLTGIPNQFGFPATQPLGSEPTTGLTANFTSLPGYLEQAVQYLISGPGGTISPTTGIGGGGLLGYLNPATYLTAIQSLLSGNLPSVLNDIPFLGLLGLPEPGDLLGSLGDLSSLLPGGLGDLTSLLPGGLGDLTSLLGGSFDPTTIGADLSSLLPNAGADIASMLGPELGNLIPNLLAGLIP